MSASSPRGPDGERRRLFEAARLRLARLHLARGTPLADAFREAVELSARTLRVERAGVWLFVDGNRAIRCYALYEGHTRQHSEGTVLRVEDFPGYFAALADRPAIAAEHARGDAATRELAAAYLEPLGIQSMLDAPIFADGQLRGVVCHESRAARAWSAQDRDFASSVADRIALQLAEHARREAEALAEAREAHLAELGRMEALGHLAAGVAHDFRNVLTIVIGCAHEIAHDPAATPTVASAAREIIEAAERGGALARELLAFGRDERSSARVVDVTETVLAVAPLLRKALGPSHTLVIETRAVGRVLIDPDQLERVLLNLAMNARDAMPEGGAVELTVREARLDGGPGVFVVIELRDTGVGMDDLTRARLFEPFFTTKDAGVGSGIGMAVVHRIVERAGGFVHVESAPGQGTLVRVVLPRVASAES